MDWFKKGSSPPELVKTTSQNLKLLLDQKLDAKLVKKAQEKVSGNLNAMKFLLYGNEEQEAKPELIKKLTDELFKCDILLELIQNMQLLEFEARKDVAQIYNFVLHQRKDVAVDYIKTHKEILRILVHAYSDPLPGIALNCGSILREAIRHKELNEIILNSPLFERFFDFVQLSTFDVASDALHSFKLILTKHKAQAAKYLESNYDAVFDRFNILLESKNYVTKRQSLKLLGELLLNRTNFNIMMRYINDPTNLKIMMNLLRAPTKDIQLEAFHVFKIFVANPKKSRQVMEILLRNRDKLVDFLNRFQIEKDGDDQFQDEKGILLRTLADLDESMLASAEPAPVRGAAPGGGVPGFAPAGAAAAAPHPAAAAAAGAPPADDGDEDAE